MSSESENESIASYEEGEEQSEEFETESEDEQENNTELKSIPLGELLELKKNGNRDQAIFRNRKGRSRIVKKRQDKNAPAEISSKVRPPKYREIVKSQNRKIRDPRFESLCGVYNEELYNKSYSFLDNQIENEISKFKKVMKKSKDEGQTREMQVKYYLNLKKELTKLQQHKKKKYLNDAIKNKKRELRKIENESILKGKKPFFMKKKELDEIKEKEKLKLYENDGKLERYLIKKRKRESNKAVPWNQTKKVAN